MSLHLMLIYILLLEKDTFLLVSNHSNKCTDIIHLIGEIASVEGTPLDFRKPRSIRERYTEVSEVGYDNNFCLNSTPIYPTDNTLHFAAKYVHP